MTRSPFIETNFYHLSHPVFVDHWWDHANGGVGSASVVDTLDPAADSEPSRRISRPQVAVVELDLRCRPDLSLDTSARFFG